MNIIPKVKVCSEYMKWTFLELSSCVLVMHRFPRDCILGGGGGGEGGGAGDSWWNLQISHIPPPAPRVPTPPPKATRAPYILHTNKTFTGEVSFLFFASTLLLHCGASFFPSLFPSLSGSLSSNLERVHMIIRYHMCSWALWTYVRFIPHRFSY